MNSFQPSQHLHATSRLSRARVLVVGVGGLGSPAASILARSGIGHLTLVDDDTVNLSNLHRQTLFHERDAGLPKVEVAAIELKRQSAKSGFDLAVHTHQKRILPDTALEYIDNHDLVLEGGDNFATKFMMADACHIAQTPLVQAGVVRWSGWALGYRPAAKDKAQVNSNACMRCIFEDIPREQPETCSQAGVIGPVVGVLAAIQAAIALRLLGGENTRESSAAGHLHTYRGLTGQLRSTQPMQSPACPLCSGKINRMEMARYLPPECAA